MADIMTKKQRSYTMSRIRSKWTKQEKLVHNKLKSLHIKHQMHPKIKGSPDIILKNKKIAVFLHGCFFHKCPKCYVEPKSNKNYWVPKITRNVSRDKKNLKALKLAGFKVLCVWEHEIKKDFERVITKIIN